MTFENHDLVCLWLKQQSVFITLQYIALHSMDPKLVKMTVGCGICHINTKHMYRPSGVLTQEKPSIHSDYTQGYLKICGMSLCETTTS